MVSDAIMAIYQLEHFERRGRRARFYPNARAIRVFTLAQSIKELELESEEEKNDKD
jgi:hypothetical protein